MPSGVYKRKKKVKIINICKFEGCNDEVLCKEVCGRHYRHINRHEINIRKRKYRKTNREKIRAKDRACYRVNKEKQRERRRIYYYKNQDKEKKYRDKYRRDNKDKIFVQMKKKLKTNHIFRFNHNISAAIYKSLKGNKSGRHWEDLVGYTLKDLKKHLEKQFDNKMSWNNYGSYWHLDHIIPLSCYKDCTEETILKKAWALSNFQPLERMKNFKKNNKLALQYT